MISAAQDSAGPRPRRRPDLNLRGDGHRIVHGGVRHTGPAGLDENLIAELEVLVPFAPRNPPQGLACFDTAFHRPRGRLARSEAILPNPTARGHLRSGVHGLSFAHIAGVLPRWIGDRAKGRGGVADLVGHGARACSGSRASETTFGYARCAGPRRPARRSTCSRPPRRAQEELFCRRPGAASMPAWSRVASARTRRPAGPISAGGSRSSASTRDPTTEAVPALTGPARRSRSA